MSWNFAFTFLSDFPSIPLHYTYVTLPPYYSAPLFYLTSLPFDFLQFPPHQRFVSFISFLALFLKLLELQQKFRKASACSWSQNCRPPGVANVEADSWERLTFSCGNLQRDHKNMFNAPWRNSFCRQPTTLKLASNTGPRGTLGWMLNGTFSKQNDRPPFARRMGGGGRTLLHIDGSYLGLFNLASALQLNPLAGLQHYCSLAVTTESLLFLVCGISQWRTGCRHSRSRNSISHMSHLIRPQIHINSNILELWWS
jgi:hypothetical protein